METQTTEADTAAGLHLRHAIDRDRIDQVRRTGVEDEARAVRPSQMHTAAEDDSTSHEANVLVKR
jgi:hypothetical protein